MKTVKYLIISVVVLLVIPMKANANGLSNFDFQGKYSSIVNYDDLGLPPKGPTSKCVPYVYNTIPDFSHFVCTDLGKYGGAYFVDCRGFQSVDRTTTYWQIVWFTDDREGCERIRKGFNKGQGF